MNKKIYIIATGMNGYDTMTTQAIAKVRECELLIGAKRMLAFFSDLEKESFVSYRYDEICEKIQKSAYTKIGILMSGDCGFFSGAEKLSEYLKNNTVEILCGISSPIYFCAKLKMKWEDMVFVSLHGRNANIISNIARNKKTFFLLGGEIKAEHICKMMCDYGIENLTVHIGENLAMENERIVSDTAKNLQHIHTDTLCVMIVENPYDETYVRTNIPDSEFIRDKIPMTKSEIRSICVAKLNIESDDICWDIGCGTGSVAVEMAMRCFNGKVCAVDKNELAVSLTEQNKYHFQCDNIEIFSGEVTKFIPSLPMPDCVFIGGSSGKLEELIRMILERNPFAKIMVTAVSLETLSESIRIFENFGKTPEIMQIAVTRTKKIGTHTMLSAENPIFLIRNLSLTTYSCDN